MGKNHLCGTADDLRRAGTRASLGASVVCAAVCVVIFAIGSLQRGALFALLGAMTLLITIDDWHTLAVENSAHRRWRRVEGGYLLKTPASLALTHAVTGLGLVVLSPALLWFMALTRVVTPPVRVMLTPGLLTLFLKSAGAVVRPFLFRPFLPEVFVSPALLSVRCNSAHQWTAEWDERTEITDSRGLSCVHMDNRVHSGWLIGMHGAPCGHSYLQRTVSLLARHPIERRALGTAEGAAVLAKIL